MKIGIDIGIDDAGLGNGAGRVPWDEIVAVGIRTTADGPWAEDVFWHFQTRRGNFELPGAWIDGAAIGTMHARLPGLDDRKIIAAMGSTHERLWRIWHTTAQARWDDARLGARFAALVGRLGGAPSHADTVFQRVRAAWSEPARRYHDREHLAECLLELDGAGAEPDLADIAELALWYHDACYDARARDNEERSAAWLLEDGARLALPADCLREAVACVRATAHLACPATSSPAADLVVDADLAILGRDALRFMEFEYAVAEEYAFVAPLRFILARGRFLAGVLASRSIYRTEVFRAKYEAQARANVAALLASRRYRLHRWFGRVAVLVV